MQAKNTVEEVPRNGSRVDNDVFLLTPFILARRQTEVKSTFHFGLQCAKNDSRKFQKVDLGTFPVGQCFSTIF